MKIFNSLNIPRMYKNSAIAIGNFDGVHKGHQKVFKETRKLAKVGFRKHCQKRHTKNTTPVINMLQKEGPEKWSFDAF